MAKEKSPATAMEAEELPKTIVRRVVKEKLSKISGDGGDVTLHKEALLAFSESARIFIHYLSATAHDVCNDSNRQIINADDVLTALEEIEFSEFVEPLRGSLEEFRKKAAGKRAGSAKAKEANKKRKADEETATRNDKDEDKVDNEVDESEDKVDDEVDEDEDKVDNEVDEDEDKVDNEDDKDEDKVDNEINEDEDEEQASEGKDDSHDS